MCDNSSKQKRYFKEEDILSSTTFFIEALFTTLAIHAYEGRDVTKIDVTGSHIYAETPRYKRVLLKLRGQFVDIMYINPYENGGKVFLSNCVTGYLRMH